MAIKRLMSKNFLLIFFSFSSFLIVCKYFYYSCIRSSSFIPRAAALHVGQGKRFNWWLSIKIMCSNFVLFQLMLQSFQSGHCHNPIRSSSLHPAIVCGSFVVTGLLNNIYNIIAYEEFQHHFNE